MCRLQHVPLLYLTWDSVLPCADCVPDADTYEPDSETAVLARRMHRLLDESRSGGVFHNQLNLDGVSAKVTLQAMGLAIGDQVIVGGVKVSEECF